MWRCYTRSFLTNKSRFFCLPTFLAIIDAYPNTPTVEQGSTLTLVCRVVGVPSTTVLSYQWTCPGGYCDAGGVDPVWAARVQQDNILVVNIRTHEDTGTYTCIVHESAQQIVTESYKFLVAGECQSGDVRLTKVWCTTIGVHSRK